jgi:hypothetical protein
LIIKLLLKIQKSELLIKESEYFDIKDFLKQFTINNNDEFFFFFNNNSYIGKLDSISKINNIGINYNIFFIIGILYILIIMFYYESY